MKTIRNFYIAAIGVLIFGLSSQGTMAQSPLFKPYKMPAEAGAAVQLFLGIGQTTGALTADNFRVETNEETGCIQNVGGVILEEGSRVDGDIEIITVAQGDTVNLCE